LPGSEAVMRFGLALREPGEGDDICPVPGNRTPENSVSPGRGTLNPPDTFDRKSIPDAVKPKHIGKPARRSRVFCLPAGMPTLYRMVTVRFGYRFTLFARVFPYLLYSCQGAVKGGKWDPPAGSAHDSARKGGERRPPQRPFASGAGSTGTMRLAPSSSPGEQAGL
jgi:hypothetical protein